MEVPFEIIPASVDDIRTLINEMSGTYTTKIKIAYRHYNVAFYAFIAPV
ncbi:hypothetical protein RG963_05725 [Methanosarcina sp. Z-7115]|uniref:Uncharacterized protein n=1 Tax=Methanosarcina baikalica TaxID=3073890 RepID=A0ABU2CZX8_9EURY|nr:hypothetical protein [Methanosarcina sp. Z-7115]MDR7665290.1 hypothetical protein [Methanosarcina sp. Z-7115]